MRPFVQHYDAIYSDKDYRADTEILRGLVKPPARPHLLEIGAGTGNQTLLLNEWADVTAVETDADFMEILRQKCAAQPSITIFEKDIGALPAMQGDGAAAYFHVVNYIHDEHTLAHLFKEIAGRLKPKAPFLFDMWHGECVMSDPPRATTRVKAFSNYLGKGIVTQIIKPALDMPRRTVTLNYTITVEMEDQAALAPFDETIRLHLWRQNEIVAALRQAGFYEIEFHDGRNFAQAATAQSWTLWVTART